MKQSRLTWREVAGFFDQSGSVYVGHRYRKGNRYRLRFSAYDRQLLNSLHDFFDSGCLYSEPRKRGLYYRFEIVGHDNVIDTLEHMLPSLNRKKLVAEKWIKELQ